MRYLSQFAANRCEQAKELVCRCRCGGLLHGAKRIADGGDFSQLPDDDPHYRPSLTPKQALKMLRRAYSSVQMGPGWGTDAWHESLRILAAAQKKVQESSK